MRRLSGREEFCLWAGRERFTLAQTETMLACAAKLHRLTTEECNGFRDEAHEARATKAHERARKMLDEALSESSFAAYSSDGWLTTRLCEIRHEHETCTGRAVPR